MILSRTGRGFTKPSAGAQINWGHPLSRGLIGCWLLNREARNYADGVVFTPVGSPTYSATVIGLGGQSTAGGNATGWDSPTSSTYLTPTRFSMFAYVISPPAATNRTILSRGASPYSWYLAVEVFGGTNRAALFVSSDGAWLNGLTVVPPSVPVTLAGTYDGANRRIYLNGRLDEVPDASSGATYGSHHVHVGGRADHANSKDYGAGLGAIYLWERELPASAILWLHAERYAFLLSQSPSVKYFLPAAGGATWPGWMSSRGGWS